MKNALVGKLARALLYEGYILYPYRPSVKNQQRWTFGGVYPPAWSAAQEGADPQAMQTQCLVEIGDATSLQIKVRFLHLVDRTIGQLTPPLEELPATGEPAMQLVQCVEIGGNQYQAWQEAIEREIDLGDFAIESLLTGATRKTFSFPSQKNIEQLRSPGGAVLAILIRRQEAIAGRIELSARKLEENLIRVTVRIANDTELSDVKEASRDDALMRTFVSTHTILGVENGKFVSQMDPPERWREYSAACSNIGAWPALVGAPGSHDTMLASPIIVEDYPKIAAESPGDLFDSGEIDEILTLRIMTLTDEEKRVAAGVDDRVRDMLERTHTLARDQLSSLHGTLRRVGHGIAAGDRVRLHPLGRGDVMDIALDGKAATVVAIEQDFENRVYVAVTIDDDPGRDLGARGQPGHRFFFGIEEVELLGTAEVAS
jgi:hypothetical protein